MAYSFHDLLGARDAVPPVAQIHKQILRGVIEFGCWQLPNDNVPRLNHVDPSRRPANADNVVFY